MNLLILLLAMWAQKYIFLKFPPCLRVYNDVTA